MDARLRRIQANCGELCNLRRPTVAHKGERFNYSSAPVNCGWLLADDTGIDATLEQKWPPKAPPALPLNPTLRNFVASLLRSFVTLSLAAL